MLLTSSQTHTQGLDTSWKVFSALTLVCKWLWQVSELTMAPMASEMILKLLLDICSLMTWLQRNELKVKSMDQPTSHLIRERKGMQMLDPSQLTCQKSRQVLVQQTHTSTITRTEYHKLTMEQKSQPAESQAKQANNNLKCTHDNKKSKAIGRSMKRQLLALLPSL